MGEHDLFFGATLRVEHVSSVLTFCRCLNLFSVYEGVRALKRDSTIRDISI